MKDTQLKALKYIKDKEIRRQYSYIAKEPVTDSVLGITWTGGDASAGAINGAIQIAEAAGETDVTLWDVNNENHTGISFATAKQIAGEIALAYRQVMFERNDKLSSIAAATTSEAVEAI